MNEVLPERRSFATSAAVALFSIVLGACTFHVHLPPAPVTVESDVERTRRAIAEIRSLGSTIEAYAIDYNKYPYPPIGPTLAVGEEKLVPLRTIAEILIPYRKVQPLSDPWGSSYYYWTDAALQNYAVVSLGADGKLSSEELIARILGILNDRKLALAPVSTSCFEDDLLLVDGQLVVWPQHEVRKCSAAETTRPDQPRSSLEVIAPRPHLPNVRHPRDATWITTFGDLPTTPLFAGFRSGMTPIEARALAPETKQDVIHRKSKEASGSSPPVEDLVIRLSGFIDLGERGDLDLYFGSGQLFACRFKPEDVVAYGQALGAFPVVDVVRAGAAPSRLCYWLWQEAPGRWAFCFSDALRSRPPYLVSPYLEDFTG